MNLKKTEEIIIPAYSSKAVYDSVKKICKPIFVDINSSDANINIKELKRKISSKTKAIITTNNYGKSDDMKNILKIADKKKISIIEDLAQTPFGKFYGKNLGTFGDYTILSFGVNKEITCIKGGAILCNNGEFKNKTGRLNLNSSYCFFRLLLNNLFEFIRTNNNFSKFASLIDNEFIKMDTNKKIYFKNKGGEITNYMAYLLNLQIKNLDTKIKKRKKNAEFILENIKYNKKFNLKYHNFNHTYYRFTLKAKNRDIILKKAQKNGINFGKMYDYFLAPLPNSVIASRMNINIPVHHNLKEIERQRIINFINKTKFN